METTLDVKRVQDFSYLTFKRGPKDVREAFINRCMDVMQTACNGVKNECLLGLKLKDLQRSNGWSCLLDEQGEYYNFDRFGELCERLFGFSKTRTSNLLAIAQFVKQDEDGEVQFIDEAYEKYKFSQLVELSSAGSNTYHCFSPEMTVKDMRLIKKLMRTTYSGHWTPEEALEKAREKFEKKPEVQVVQLPIVQTEDVQEDAKPTDEQEEVKSDVGIEGQGAEEAESEETVSKVSAKAFRAEVLMCFAKSIKDADIRAIFDPNNKGLGVKFTPKALAESMEYHYIKALVNFSTEFKNLLQRDIEKFLNSFDYTITLNGRKQAIKGFSGSLAGTFASRLRDFFDELMRVE